MVKHLLSHNDLNNIPKEMLDPYLDLSVEGGPIHILSIKSSNLAPRSIRLADRVRTHSLNTDEMNDQTGIVVKYISGSNRYQIRLDDDRGVAIR